MISRIKNWTGYGYIWSLNFPFILDNVHKHPLVSKIMCILGRHDFEYAGPSVVDADGVCGLLECFQCQRLKLSRTRRS